MFLSFAVAAADHPDTSLFSFDTIYGIDDLPLPLAVYKAQSIELLEGAVAYVTPLRVLDVAHILIVALAAFCIPIAYARLLRPLLPRGWLWGVVCVLAFLLCVGDTHRIGGNFAFVRLQQGKSILVSICTPLILAYCLEYSRAPSRKGWLMLAAAQIMALGMSATALWLAPMVAVVGLASGTAYARNKSVSTFAIGCLSCSYVVAIALSFVSASQEHLGYSGSILEAYLPGTIAILCLGVFMWMMVKWTILRTIVRGITGTALALVLLISVSGLAEASVHQLGFETGAERLPRTALEMVVGRGPAAYAILLALVGGWSFCPSAILRRLMVFFGLTFFILWSPFTAEWVAANVTGRPVYWRIFWLLPIPLALAVVMTSPLRIQLRAQVFWFHRLATIGCLGIVALALPEVQILSRANGVTFTRPGWRIPDEVLGALQALAEHTDPGQLVVAPYSVSAWIPTIHNHPAPLLVGGNFDKILRRFRGFDAARRLTQFTSYDSRLALPGSRTNLTVRVLRDGLKLFSPSAICLRKEAYHRRVRAILNKAGFELVFQDSSFLVWARTR